MKNLWGNTLRNTLTIVKQRKPLAYKYGKLLISPDESWNIETLPKLKTALIELPVDLNEPFE